MEVLNDWATDPAATHVAVTPDTADLEKLFAELAANISKTGATDVYKRQSKHRWNYILSPSSLRWLSGPDLIEWPYVHFTSAASIVPFDTRHILWYDETVCDKLCCIKREAEFYGR